MMHVNYQMGNLYLSHLLGGGPGELDPTGVQPGLEIIL